MMCRKTKGKFILLTNSRENEFHPKHWSNFDIIVEALKSKMPQNFQLFHEVERSTRK